MKCMPMRRRYDHSSEIIHSFFSRRPCEGSGPAPFAQRRITTKHPKSLGSCLRRNDEVFDFFLMNVPGSLDYEKVDVNRLTPAALPALPALYL